MGSGFESPPPAPQNRSRSSCGRCRTSRAATVRASCVSEMSSGTTVHPAQDHGAALPVDPALLDGSGQLTHQATAPPPSLHTPHATRGVGQPLALQLHVPGSMELVEPHRHGHGSDEPEHQPRYQGRWSWLSPTATATAAMSQSTSRALSASHGSSQGSTYSTVSQARTLRARTPTTAATTALDAACRSSLNRSNPRSPTSRFGSLHRSIQGGTGSSSAGSSSSPWNRARRGPPGHDQGRRRLARRRRRYQT